MARTLSQGTSGDDVKMLQAVLNYHRFVPTDEILTVDGAFGPRTTKRVKAFQTQNQLDPDGIVGPNTRSALLTVCQFSAQYTATRDPTDFAVGGGVGDPPGTTVTREYELSSGLKLALNPWEKPPAKATYVLEFEAAWVLKNPKLPGAFAFGIGAEIGRTLTTPALDAPYVYSGAGHVMGKFERDFTLDPIKLDTSLQATFEAEHEVRSPDVAVHSQLSLASGISFAIVRERFYLFAQGEAGLVINWTPGDIAASTQWEGMIGAKVSF